MSDDLLSLSTMHHELDELELLVTLATLQSMQMEQDNKLLKAENTMLQETIAQLIPKGVLH
jgi:hypothetical protein